MSRFFVAFMCLYSVVFGDNLSSSAPYISGNTFRSICNHFFDEYDASLDPSKVHIGDIIFVKSDYLEKFFKKFHPQIHNPYILVSHNADHGVEGRYRKYLDEGKIYNWFGQNCASFKHPKLHPIPIGIANKKWKHGRVETFDLVRSLLPGISKDHLISYAGVAHTNPAVRRASDKYFKSQAWCTLLKRTSHQRYLVNLARGQFTVCPAGNGLDTHRLWEALLMGTIPVVLTSHGDEMFEDLPVMVVNCWEEVTRESLENFAVKIREKGHNRDKIFADYWLNWIRAASRECQERVACGG